MRSRSMARKSASSGVRLHRRPIGSRPQSSFASRSRSMALRRRLRRASADRARHGRSPSTRRSSLTYARRSITPASLLLQARALGRRPRSTYVFPYAVFSDAVPALGFIGINLVRRPNPKTTSVLRPPEVVEEQIDAAFGGTLVQLAPSTRLGRPRFPSDLLRSSGPAPFMGGVSISLVRRPNPSTIRSFARL